MTRAATTIVMECYPLIFHACHRTHVSDPASGNVLSARQASVLDHLDTTDGRFLHELASHMGITPSSMSLMIDRLERGGYVRRSRDSADARRVSLRLTPAGARIKARQQVLDPQLVSAMLALMPAEQREAAMVSLKALAQAASELLASDKRRQLKQEAKA